MKVKQVKLVYFSPTGTTQQVLESIAKGLAVEDVETINLTLSKEARQTLPLFSDELVIIGAPVYGGRLPVDAIRRFQQLKPNNTPAVLIVMYGNREFEDALLELKNLAIELGFRPVAGAAFIGEHSFATKDVPIANGRPDRRDLQTAIEFGARVKEKVAAMQSPEAPADLDLPGTFPYEATGTRLKAVSPVTKEETCSVCGTCASVCPTEAISIDGGVATDIELCIRCCACIKNCPTGARVIEDSQWEAIVNWLHEHCRARKEPQIFGIDV